MADDQRLLDNWGGMLIARLQPAERRRLAAAIARDLRRSQQRRIAAQRNVDGSPYAPRKAQPTPPRQRKGRIKRKRAAMFTKLRTARWLATHASPDLAEVGFMGRVARLARVHHEGLADIVGKRGKKVRYPKRQLLGFTEIDRAIVRDRIIDHLSTKLF